ncbi:hypothetical protein GCM10023168_30400 [Fodinibacter luteus]|uniref:Protein NO VEIN C-terminal domain-containing protein n=1 Tax=Fodinibacter luteus TaxID=552064 RepID=A0ABP8KMX8_9MICO
MSSPANLDWELGDILGQGGRWTFDEVLHLLASRMQGTMSAIEGAFGQAGWYGGGAAPYPAPTIPFEAPQPANPAVVEVDRRLWIARYNPADPDFDVPDIADDSKFPWQHPEAAPREGWWLSTVDTPRGRPAISEVATGDLVICQRTNPTGNGGDLVGVCAIGMTASWEDAQTGRRERAACLIPLTKFTYPVPRSIARRQGRLRVQSLRAGQQLPGRQGPIGFGLSFVEWDDVPELISVCGIPPEALAETDTARLAARLRASDTGNRLNFKLRYDAVVRNGVRRIREREAERAAEVWADVNGYVKHGEFQHVPLAGFDLLFIDAHGDELQVEVKGYMTRRLAAVHLQPSQAQRATDAAAGQVPAWRLFALLGAGTQTLDERVLSPQSVVDLISKGGLRVKGGWPTTRAH